MSSDHPTQDSVDDPPRAFGPVRSIARAALQARDPHIKGIVMSRLFARAVEPHRIGRFTLLDRLGEGGMGVVYAAYDDQLDRRVAVKVLRSWVTRDDSRGRSRLLHEARAMARLSHPNIVTVHEVGTHEGDVFVAMEHVRGQSLDRWIEVPGGRPWAEVVQVFAAAGRGLAAAHRAGIVHRDFKPHNVILGDDGVVKVLDFGLARVLAPVSDEGSADSSDSPETASASITRTGTVMGTPAYMAPEQREGGVVDERSDQFSFFASLDHALHRRLPFASPGVLAPPPADSSVPRWLHRAVHVGLHPDPRERHPSMAAAIAAITRDPAARRRRWLSLGGSALAISVVSVLAAGRMSAPASSPAQCELGASAMGEIWHDSARSEVRNGLADSGLPFVYETWERLEPRLDDYAGRWTSARDEACVAHRDGARSASLYDLQVACLERRRVAMGSLVGLLGSADGPSAGRALSAAAALPDPEGCSDPTTLLASVPAPEEPGLAQEVEAQRHRLAKVRGHETLGQVDAGLELARDVAERAERLGYRPLRAEALVRLASLTMEHGAAVDAERLLTEALTHALATDHPSVAAEAAALRIFVRAERLRVPERATDDVALGAGLVQRAGIEPRLHGLYLNNVGAYHIRREDHDAAREALERALEVERQGLDPDDPELAVTLGNLSIVEQHTGHDERAWAHLDEAFALVQRVLGPHHATTAGVARLRGELLFRSGHPREARSALESVLDTLRQTTTRDSTLLHGPLTMLGELSLGERRYAEALARFDEAAALELSRDGAGSMYRVLEEVGRARALMGLGQRQRGRDAFERALARAEAAEAPYLLVLCELYGRTLLLHGHAKEAASLLDRALDSAAIRGEADGFTLASVLSAQGQALRRLGRPDEADVLLIEAIDHLDRLGGDHPQDRGAALVERALVARDRGHREAAVAHAREALEVLAAWGEADHLDRAAARSALAQALAAGVPTVAERAEAQDLAARARSSFAGRGPAFEAELAPLDAVLIKLAPRSN